MHVRSSMTFFFDDDSEECSVDTEVGTQAIDDGFGSTNYGIPGNDYRPLKPLLPVQWDVTLTAVSVRMVKEVYTQFGMFVWTSLQ